MTKHERRQFFDRLVQLRALYRLRGSDDSTAEMSIDEAIAYAERLIDDADALAATIGAEADRHPESETPEPRRS
ncbi:MAG: hypothetical protein ABI562_04255 [Chloroflexota bacterium]